SSAAVLNYAEARSAESRKDFVHKCSLVLKELRECHAVLKLLPRFDLGLGSIDIQDVVKENDELICIFVKSVSTARSRLKGKI
ncbi:MAG: four helix bundle protein, partial [Bacteroidales bacterium]|nr:four helix bundle protein [Bacteroidales bacterium]